VFNLYAFRPSAVIFDLDGTLADNMAWHARAFDEFVRDHGLPPVSLEQRRHMDGKRNAEIFPMLFGRLLDEAEIQRFEEEKEGRYRELSRGALREMAGAVRLLDVLAKRGVAVAIATSAPRANVGHTLGELGLADRFAIIARSDEVPKGKPAPDVYLRAAELLSVMPESCLAFEDAPVGVAAARAAGMPCVAITSTYTPETFARWTPPPTATYPHFEDFLADAGAWLLEGAEDAVVRARRGER
jgi:HAD superfamily hydrolase (TIGR01509 family)